MNFGSFSVPLSTAMPVTQFSTGKLTQSVTTANGQVVGVLQGGENGVHYIRPLDANTFGGAMGAGNNQTNTGINTNTQQSVTPTLITLPITMPGAKPGDPQQHVQIQVVGPPTLQQPTVTGTVTTPTTSSITPVSSSVASTPKYHLSQIPIQTFAQGTTVLTVAYNQNQDGSIQIIDGQNGIPEGMTVVAALQPQDIQLIQADPESVKQAAEMGGLITPVALIKSEVNKDDLEADGCGNGAVANACSDGSNANVNVGGGCGNESHVDNTGGASGSGAGGSMITAAIPAQILHNASVQEYLQKFQHSLNLHQFLKFNNHPSIDIKREPMSASEMACEQAMLNIHNNNNAVGIGGHHIFDHITIGQTHEHPGSGDLIVNETMNMGTGQETENTIDDAKGKGKTGAKKKYKKKPPKPKKPKPGQVHIATALDGTTLFCCPECHMAYPEKESLEQHLVGHKIERRFICDICGAGLKRKEHLERHKLGHNPERPFVCSVCMKGFKRKEHLNLHFVIHSGEKTEICGECGKGFYRKDHLRKHARSHVTRRARELAERAQNTIILKDSAQVTIQVPSSQMQIPVHIQVPQHHIQMATNNNNEEEGVNQVSTVVLPGVGEGLTIVPQTGN